MAATNRFKSSLQKALWSELRREGFLGSGATVRRISGPVVHVVNIQGSSGGESCFINMGAHLSLLPTEGGGVVVPNELLEYQCAFRARIEPPAGPAFGWSYQEELVAATETVDFILSEWQRVGRAFFDKYMAFPDSFRSLVLAADPNEVHPAGLLTLSRVALLAGELHQGKRLASAGLARAPERATLLRNALDEALRSCEAG